MVTAETVFQIALIAFIAAFMSVRMYFHRRAGTLGESVAEDANRLLPLLRRIVGLPWVAGMFAYMLSPAWMAWAAAPLPAGARWLGVGIGAATILLLIWIHRALGRNFTTVARTRAEQTLVTGGPYRWVRHPMYPTLWMFSLATFLISANWFVGLPPLAIVTLIMLTRPAREEQQLMEKFGDTYRDYMTRTGRFLPRFGR